MGAIEYCRAVVQHHSRTFYLGSRFFPADQRAALWTVYAVCRVGDDLVDDPLGGSRAMRRLALERWWRNVQSAYAGDGDRGSLWVALGWVARSFDVPRDAFHELYQGLAMDLDGTAYATLDDLELYCRRVAGVVGLMVAPICGYAGGAETLERALRLGQAMQLTNILRDVGEDLGYNRLYLPTAMLDDFGIARDDLQAGAVSPAYAALLRDLIVRARSWYREGERGLPLLSGSGRVGVAVAARAYEGILDDLERHGYNNLTRRPFVTLHRRLAMVPGAWWRMNVAGRMGRSQTAVS
jgi:15-cis-phytoene synthase